IASRGAPESEVMGRVYNALVKADRLTDAQRPIGRPEGDAATPRQGDAASVATPPPVRRDSHPAPVFGIGNEHHTEQPETPGSTLASDFEQLFALSESSAAKRAVEPLLPPIPAPVAPSPHRPIAPPVFE